MSKKKVTGKQVVRWVKKADPREREWLRELCRALRDVDDYSTSIRGDYEDEPF